MRKTVNSTFYGDITRWFIGVVEEVGTDEPKLGRVRVRINGIHGDESEVKTSDLPYASVLVPTTEPGVSGLGRSPHLHPGAQVFGIFLDGRNSQLPMVFGSIPRVEVPSNEQQYSIRDEIPYQDAIRKSTGVITPGVPGSDGLTPSIKSALDLGIDAYRVRRVNSNLQIAFDYLLKKERYSQKQIAAMLGNFLTESGPSDIDPGYNDDRTLHGIARYPVNGARNLGLLNMAKEKGMSPDDLFIQLEYIDHELSNSTFYRGEEFKTLTQLDELAAFFHRYFCLPDAVNEGGINLNAIGIPIQSLVLETDKVSREDEAIRNTRDVYHNFVRRVGV